MFIKPVKEITKRRAEESTRTTEMAFLIADFRETMGEDREEREKKEENYKKRN